jgi:hypothetical protein
MSKPTRMYGKCGKKSFIANVTPDGYDWVIKVTDASTGEDFTRWRSTLQARPDNGALEVTKLLRQQFNITGIFATR